MRSRTSRGVPEWSGGEELYIGSPVSATGKVSGLSVLYRDHRKGSGVVSDKTGAPGVTGTLREVNGPHGPNVEKRKGLPGQAARPLSP